MKLHPRTDDVLGRLGSLEQPMPWQCPLRLVHTVLGQAATFEGQRTQGMQGAHVNVRAASLDCRGGWPFGATLKFDLETCLKEAF